jgi:hypothetical protein
MRSLDVFVKSGQHLPKSRRIASLPVRQIFGHALPSFNIVAIKYGYTATFTEPGILMIGSRHGKASTFCPLSEIWTTNSERSVVRRSQLADIINL